MKIHHLISEAIQNPTGPQKIPTGGKSSIANPAHMASAYYEGDPANFNFGLQRKNYEKIAAALARNGKKLTYIGVAKSAAGPDTFVAIAPGFVWYKYVAGSAEGAQNSVYVNGAKMQTTTFLARPAAEQDAMMSSTAATVKVNIKDGLGYLRALIASSMTPQEISADLAANKDTLTALLQRVLRFVSTDDHEKLRRLLARLAKKTTIPAWLDIDHLISLNMPDVMQAIARKIPNYVSSLLGDIDDYRKVGYPITDDLLIDIIMSKKSEIINWFRDVKNMVTQGAGQLIDILHGFNINWPELTEDALTAYITDSDIISELKLGTTYNLSNVVHMFAQHGLLNNSLAKILNSKKSEILKQLTTPYFKEELALSNLNTVAKTLAHFKQNAQLLNVNWPELNSDEWLKYTDYTVPNIFKILLDGLESRYTIHSIKDIIENLKKLNVGWSELDTIEDSMS